MSSSLLVTLEIMLVLGGVLGFAGWDLWRMRRDPRPPPAPTPEPPVTPSDERRP